MAFEFITPKHYPLSAVVGDDWRIFIPIVQADGEDFNFSGWNAFSQVRNRSNGALIIEFDTYDSTIIFADGGMYLIADKDETTQIDPNNYIYDCQFLDPWGYRRTLILISSFDALKQSTK